MKVGTDTGGTFTDIVTDGGEITKVFSTPANPALAVREGLGALGFTDEALTGEALTDEALTGEALGDEGLGSGSSGGAFPAPVFPAPVFLAHGTTIATNAILERKGAKVGLITNDGFQDLIEIGRQDRPSLYDPLADRPEPLVGREFRYGIGGRLGATGEELEAVSPENIAHLASEIHPSVEALAVCLLHSDLNPSHEKAVAKALRELEFDVSCSIDVAPEFREYERISTVVMNAYLRLLCRDYLNSLEGIADLTLVITSAGGLIPIAEAADAPVRLLLSGPAGGVRAGAFYGAANGYNDIVTFDMGGTSTDVCLVLDGKPEAASQRLMAGLPVRMPALDVLTIGAGGGSIARIDPGGALVVGPESAGANPGPACYGMGGTHATVTDANLAIGHISPETNFPSLGRLDKDLAETALKKVGGNASADATSVDDASASTAAAGDVSGNNNPAHIAKDILDVVNNNMEQAIRSITIDRGVDPRELALVAFGGAGPLHACALAELLGMETVIIPPRAGVLSAVGVLGSPPQIDQVISWHTPNDHSNLDAALLELQAQTKAALPDAISCEVSLDCRYAGQSHELNVPDLASFHEVHRRRNGYVMENQPVEVIALRATAKAKPALDLSDLPLPMGLEERGVEKRQVERGAEREAEREPGGRLDKTGGASGEASKGQIAGPTVLSEPDSTIWVAPGWQAEQGEAGALILRQSGKGTEKAGDRKTR